MARFFFYDKKCIKLCKPLKSVNLKLTKKGNYINIELTKIGADKMKRLKLRKEIKNILVGVALIIAIVAFINYGADRAEKINNGELVVVDESYRD